MEHKLPTLGFIGTNAIVVNNSSSQCCFTMVNVTDGANINVRLRSYVLFFCHSFLLRLLFC